MLTLIRREIVDHSAWLLLMALLSAITTSVMIAHERFGPNGGELIAMVWVLPIAMFFLCTMGVGQMHSDRTYRISPFLSTLAVTRGQILLARMAAGLVAILIALVPPGIELLILLHKYYEPIALAYSRWLAQAYVTIFLLAAANYCLGLQIGWYSQKVLLMLGTICLPAILMALVFTKGFAGDTIAILLVVVAASSAAVWLKFRSTPL
jgi:hypothetical protein